MKIFGYPIVFVDKLDHQTGGIKLGPPPVFLACPSCGAGDYFFAQWPPAAGVEYRCGVCQGAMSPPAPAAPPPPSAASDLKAQR